MSIKTWFEKKVKEKFTQFALSAVVYAEECLGSGAGQEKKKIAIDYLIGLLPVYSKPFTSIYRSLLNSIADSLIEKAVEKLHAFQKTGLCEV